MYIARPLTAMLMLIVLAAPAAAEVPTVRFPALHSLGDRFTFAIFADPQLSHRDNQGHVPASARRAQIRAVEEVNALEPPLAFAVFLGDLCNVFDEASVANFEACIAGLDAQPVLVHGNHDTLPPYAAFEALMQRQCGFRAMQYSFDVGQWHFIVLPCNLPGTFPAAKQAEADMLAWLDADLDANRDRPTMVFEHLHAMPQGLTQLEWYNFPLDLRLAIMERLTRHGNVRYYFNGHVHNGLKTSVKTAWSYKGVNFITAPTIIQARNFGEEYPAFQEGLERGGYYLLVEVDGKDVHIKGRLTECNEVFVYPGTFRAFRDEIEPRWFKTVSAFDPAPRLVNGGFERGLKGWHACYRYQADEDPGFFWEARRRPGRAFGKALYVFTKAKEPVAWANDENTELYQVVAVPGVKRPVLRALYCLDEAPSSGGGYVRLAAFADDALQFMMMFKWGEEEHKSHIMPRAFGYAIHGEQQSWAFLQQLGKKRQGLYWDVPSAPGLWHELEADVSGLYDACLGQPGAYDALGVTKCLVAVGTWVNRDAGSRSGAYFDAVALEGKRKPRASHAGGTPLNTGPEVFQCAFGQELIDRLAAQKKR